MNIRKLHSGSICGLVLGLLVSAPVAAQSDNRQVMVDMVIQIQQLQDEVRMLRGMLEDQAADLEILRNRQRDQYLDLDARLSEVRGGPAGPAIAVPSTRIDGTGVITTGAVTTQAGETSQHEGAPPDVRPVVDALSTVSTIATPNTQARDVTALPEAEKETYDEAFQSLKDLDYADAAEQFQNFLQLYPFSQYADNAQYWLGESYYVTRNYEIALEAFQGLLSKYADSPKIADGLLKIGYTHYELKQWDQARAALEQVQAQYPGTTLARLAGSRLRSMKLEGHF